MPKINVYFCYPFVKPKEPASLAVFCEARDAVPEEEAKDYLTRCRQYAKTYHIHVMPGPFVLQGRLCLCLISDEGKPVALQKAVYLNLLHHSALEVGERVQVFDTLLGKIALLAGVDIFHPETARCAMLQGAEVLLAATYFDPYDLTPARNMTGCWDAAQQNCLPVIGVSNQNCCVCAPRATTDNGSGFVLPPQTEFPALASVYTHKAQKLREEKDLLPNPAFITRYRAQLGG